MAHFVDHSGRRWKLTLTVGAARRIYRANGMNLTEPLLAVGDDPARADAEKTPTGPPLYLLLQTDCLRLYDLLECMTGPARAAAAVTDEQFGAAMAGPEFEAARAAFLEEWASFSHCLRRPEAAEAIRQTETQLAAARKICAETLASPEIAQATRRAAVQAIGSASSELRERLELTPEIGPGEIST
jgi:hypothetical protein